MNKVLIVAYSFPPVGGAGVQRPVKFVKYLRRFGWEPVVLTVSNPSVPIQDVALLKDVPEGVKIYRARSLEPSYEAKQTFSTTQTQGGGIKALIKKYISMILLPDIQVLWWPGFIAKIINVIRIERPDCLYVTAPPFSSFVPVVAVGKIFRIPVVLDYRDEWVFSRASWENSSKSRLAFFLDNFLERMVLSNCQAFTTATQSYVDSIIKHYGSGVISKGEVITNGYDADDFVYEPKNRVIEDPETITIVYTGTVWKATSLDVFCSILGKYILQNPTMKQRIRVKVFGRVVGEEARYLESTSLKDVIECYGYIDHEKVMEEMLNADILLLTLSDLPGAEKIIHGKAFEYMASGKHIFALIPDGEVKNLISEHYGNTTIVNPSDAETVYASFENLLKNIEELKKRKGKDVRGFLRENLTAKLASVFNRVSKC
jgi:glycosyltransferase involved in cell wall biosynthesis